VRVFKHGLCRVRVRIIAVRLLHGARRVFRPKFAHSRMPLIPTPLLLRLKRVRSARFSKGLYTRGCHWLPHLLALVEQA
jgi:hypothetical protein